MDCLLNNDEKEVAILVAKGYRNQDIAQKLFMSKRKVGNIIFNIKNKWNIDSRVHIGILAVHYKLVKIEHTKEKELHCI